MSVPLPGPIGFRLAVVFAFACGAMAPLARGAEVAAGASVNGKLAAGIEKTTLPGGAGANGVAIAGAKVFNPAMEDYKVNGAPANADEKAKLQGLIKAAGDIADKKENARVRAIEDWVEKAKTDTAPVGPPNAAFTEAPKGESLKSGEAEALNVPAFEFAFAEATQKRDKPPFDRYQAENTLVTKAIPIAVPKPKAVAIAINRDPLEVHWDPAFPHQVIVDLSPINFGLETSGEMSIALGLVGADAGFINGTTDLDLPQDLATPLYEFLLPVVSEAGGGASLVLDAFRFDVFGNSVFDNLGNVGEDAVRGGLLSQLTMLGPGSFGFASPYSFTVEVPGTASESVLYFRDYDAAVAMAAVPEPSTLALTGVAFAALAAFGRRARSSLWARKVRRC